MSPTQVFRERIDAWFLRRLFIPAFELRPESLRAMIDRVARHRPALVDGYAESLNFLASFVREGGKAPFSPRAMMSSAQALPAATKRAIEEAFHTKVYDKYGSREFSGIAYQCGEGDSYHVMDESYIVEILREGRAALPGEVGEVVITDLNNFSVPLIRYRIGDLATAVDNGAQCPCGRQLSRIGVIQGRTQAIVHCGNGVWLPGTFFAHFFKEYEHAIRFFQIEQHETGSFTLRVVKNNRYSDTEFATLLSDLKSFTGSETKITTEFVDQIPLLRTGKRSPVVSTVPFDFQHVPARRDSRELIE
jgi:phenylacetate-CoA ligase